MIENVTEKLPHGPESITNRSSCNTSYNKENDSITKSNTIDDAEPYDSASPSPKPPTETSVNKLFNNTGRQERSFQMIDGALIHPSLAGMDIPSVALDNINAGTVTVEDFVSLMIDDDPLRKGVPETDDDMVW